MSRPIKRSIRKQWKGLQLSLIFKGSTKVVFESARLQVLQTFSCNLKIRDLFFDTEDL